MKQQAWRSYGRWPVYTYQSASHGRRAGVRCSHAAHPCRTNHRAAGPSRSTRSSSQGTRHSGQSQPSATPQTLSVLLRTSSGCLLLLPGRQLGPQAPAHPAQPSRSLVQLLRHGSDTRSEGPARRLPRLIQLLQASNAATNAHATAVLGLELVRVRVRVLALMQVRPRLSVRCPRIGAVATLVVDPMQRPVPGSRVVSRRRIKRIELPTVQAQAALAATQLRGRARRRDR